MANEKRLIDADGKITEFPWGYFEIATKHFRFRVCSRTLGKRRERTWRAEAAVKVGDKYYLQEYEVFHPWDYRDEDDAYDHAKEWIWEVRKSLSDELADAPTVDAVEVVRCGKCRFCDTVECPMSRSPGRVSANDFCSYGERRAGE